jgi:hypothetical protein
MFNLITLYLINIYILIEKSKRTERYEKKYTFTSLAENGFPVRNYAKASVAIFRQQFATPYALVIRKRRNI